MDDINTTEGRKKKAASRHDDTMAEHIWLFLNKTKWKPAESDQQGITWIELFIRYTLAGGEVQEPEKTDDIAFQRLKSTQGLERFKRS